MKILATLSFILVMPLAVQLPACAADMDMPGMNMDRHSQAAEVHAVGVVDEVDPARNTVTITHEPIKSLGWSAMTMDFVVEDKKMLSKLTKGRKVNFTFIQQHGDYVITKVK